MSDIESFRSRAVSFLDYDPSEGSFVWRHRIPEMFVTKNKGDENRSANVWNAKNAGRAAGRVTQYGYREIAIDRKLYFAHRLAWLIVNGGWPEEVIDHIDGDRLNNRICNLRSVTIAENQRNIRIRGDSKSFYHGVTYYPTHRRWVARIGAGGRTISLGSYLTVEQAIEARKRAEAAIGYHPNHGRSFRQGLKSSAPVEQMEEA